MHWRCATLALATALLLNPALRAEKPVQKEESSFGALKSPDAAEVRKQAEAWLKAVGKADAATLAQGQDASGTPTARCSTRWPPRSPWATPTPPSCWPRPATPTRRPRPTCPRS